MQSLARALVLVVCSTIGGNALAASDFDNADVPRGKPTKVLGGCGTVTKIEWVGDKEPRFTLKLDSLKKGGIGSGSEISMLANLIPGVGTLVAAGIGTATAVVANAAIASNEQEKEAEAAKKEVAAAEAKQWEGVSLVTIKPDFGKEYTLPIEGALPGNSKITLSPNWRVFITSEALNPNGFKSFRYTPVIKPKEIPPIGTDEYFQMCHGDGKYGLRVLTDTPSGFEWKKLPPAYAAAGSAFVAKKQAEIAKKEEDKAAERAEIDAMKKNESR